jgi:hypothetical protein
MTDIVKRRDGAAARVKQEAAGPDYLTVLEVAVLARCEHKRVRRAIASGQLVAFRPAGKLLVREEDAPRLDRAASCPRGSTEGTKPSAIAAPRRATGERRRCRQAAGNGASRRLTRVG